MTEIGQGKVVTFYSFKGGTGRTMALANVAWILASNGHRVLVVDWDLESPGLHRFFRPFLTEGRLASTGGVIDLIRGYEAAAKDSEDPGRLEHAQFARVQLHAFSLNRRWPDGGTLDFLSAGRHNHHYARSIAGLNWDDFYEVHGGGLFLNALRADMKQNYDYTLIDSRTGWSDVADICTMHMPDILVACFTLSDQGIEGAATVAQQISSLTKPRQIRVLPVPTRIDSAEKDKADIGLSVARQRFRGLPRHVKDDDRDGYWTRMRVPYQSYYAYEELLATFGDVPGTPGSMLSAFETLTTAIADGQTHRMPALDRQDREQVLAQFTRLGAVQEREVTLHYDLDGLIWAEWILAVLRASGVATHDPGPGGVPDGHALAGRPLVIHTHAEHQLSPTLVSRTGPTPLRVHVADSRSSVPSVARTTAVWIAGLDAAAASDRITRLVGRPALTDDTLRGLPRFPGNEPAVRQLPPRNTQFIGRAAELHALRDLLRSDRTVTSRSTSPIVVHGPGGIGKTQLALEYAYRFRSAYDAVWWIDADPNADLDQGLADLGAELGLPPASTSDAARMVVSALSRGEPHRRWLVIFDNAEDPGRLSQLLPSGAGDVIVTSRDESAWAERGNLLGVGAFARDESMEYLRSRVPALTDEDAGRLADLLYDLPIAVTLAAAWLADSGAPVGEYLEAIEKGEFGALSSEEGRERVNATWGLSLQRLAERSPAAYRLLELCAVMAPDISLELVYSDAMARLLVSFDPTFSDPLMLGRLVSHVKRLALLQIDQQGERTRQSGGSAQTHVGNIVVHRLVQYAVRDRMTGDQLEGAKQQVHAMLATFATPLGNVDTQSQWPRFQLLWPHLGPSDAATSTDDGVRQLVVNQVRYHYLRGNPDRGLEIADEVESWWATVAESLTGKERTDLLRHLLRLRFNRANFLREKGRFDDALTLDLEVHEQQRQILSDDHPYTLMTAGSLAADYRGLGDYREALSRDERTSQAWEAFDDEDPLRLSAQSNLAVSHRLMGHLDQALLLDEQVYEARLKVLGPNHLSTLLSASSLGRDLREMGEYDRSITLLEGVVARYAAVVGEESRFFINAQANLAISLRTAGHPERAGQLLDVAYARLLTLFGNDHTDTLACRLSRSVNLLELRSEEADVEIKAVLDAYEQRLGPDHPHTLACGNNLAAALRQWNDLAQAGHQARTVTGGMDRVLGAHHPYALAARMNLAIVLAEQAEAAGEGPTGYDAALELMDSAAQRLREVLGPAHPHAMRCAANRAIIRRKRNPGPDTQAQAELTINRFADRMGAEHPAVEALIQGRMLRRIIDPHPF